VNDEITEGFPGIVNGVGRFRDLEVINLDGLPESRSAADSRRGRKGQRPPGTAPRTPRKDKPFENNLGMKFVPVPVTGGPTDGRTVLFSVWETRVKDYEAFVKATKRAWPKAEFPQTGEHPAVKVSWEDAVAFCAWLTIEDRKSGKIGPKRSTDCLPTMSGVARWGSARTKILAVSPAAKSGKITGYPWGKDFPPPKGAGNFLGEETKLNPGKDKTPISSYDDGFDRTAPVGSFAANAFGLHDLGGNVREWCDDWFDPAKPEKRILRGGSWGVSDSANLLSSYLSYDAPSSQNIYNGFRVVLEVGSGGAATADATKATKHQPFENPLGMKFVPVPITGGPTGGRTVLFSVWETRVKDYEAFVKATKREWPKPGFPQTGEHPAVAVSWEDAVGFCAWITEEDRKIGKIGREDVYRLPSDHEWSCAVGIGKDENPAASPAAKNGKITGYPWGKDFPPPKGAGNFYGEEANRDPKEVDKRNPFFPISGYNDAFEWTGPVGGFVPNALGLYDFAGGVREWCEDRFDPATPEKRLVRGGSWHWGDSSSSRLDVVLPPQRDPNFTVLRQRFPLRARNRKQPDGGIPTQNRPSPALAAMKARGGRLRAWGTDDARPLDISAADGLTDLVRIEADPVETSSGVWVAWRKDGTISRPATFPFDKNTRYREFNRQLYLDDAGRFGGEMPEGKLRAEFAQVPQGSVADVARGWSFSAILTRGGRVITGSQAGLEPALTSGRYCVDQCH